MIQDIYLLISIAVLITTIAAIVRFFKYTDESLKHKRAQTSLLALLATQHPDPTGENIDSQIFKIIRDNGLINEVPVKRAED